MVPTDMRMPRVKGLLNAFHTLVAIKFSLYEYHEYNVQDNR